MVTAEYMNHARSFLKKAQEYLAAAEDSLAAERHTPAAGDAIHAGISAKDAIVTALTGTTSKDKNNATPPWKTQQGQEPRHRSQGTEASTRSATRRSCD